VINFASVHTDWPKWSNVTDILIKVAGRCQTDGRLGGQSKARSANDDCDVDSVIAVAIVIDGMSFRPRRDLRAVSLGDAHAWNSPLGTRSNHN